MSNTFLKTAVDRAYEELKLPEDLRTVAREAPRKVHYLPARDVKKGDYLMHDGVRYRVLEDARHWHDEDTDRVVIVWLIYEEPLPCKYEHSIIAVKCRVFLVSRPKE